MDSPLQYAVRPRYCCRNTALFVCVGIAAVAAKTSFSHFLVLFPPPPPSVVRHASHHPHPFTGRRVQLFIPFFMCSSAHPDTRQLLMLLGLDFETVRKLWGAILQWPHRVSTRHHNAVGVRSAHLGGLVVERSNNPFLYVVLMCFRITIIQVKIARGCHT